MGQFYRIAESGVALINTFLGRTVGHHYFIAQFGKKMRIQRVIRVDQKGAVKADTAAARNPFVRRSCDAVLIVYEILTQAHQIQLLNVVTDFVTQIVVAVAGTAEGVLLSFDFDHCDFTSPITFFFAAPAGKGFFIHDLPLGEGLQVKALCRHQTVLNSLFDFKGHAESAHQSRLRWYDDGFAYQRRHSQRYGFVVTDTALHEYFFAHRPVTFHAIGIIHTD